MYQMYQNSELHLYVIRNGIFYSEFQKNGTNGTFSTITSKNDDFLRILRRFGGQKCTKNWYILWYIWYEIRPHLTPKCAILTHLAHCDVAHLAQRHPVFGTFWGLYHETYHLFGTFCSGQAIGTNLATILLMVKKIEKVAHDAEFPERKMVN